MVKTKSIIFYIFKIVVSLALLYYVFHQLDIEKIRYSILSITPVIITFSAILGLLLIFINSLTQKVFFSLINENVSLIKNYQHNLIGSFYGFLLPSTIGSDVYFTHYFSKEFSSLKKGLTGVLFIRLIGLLILVLMIISIILIKQYSLRKFMPNIPLQYLVYGSVVLLLLTVSIIFLFRNKLHIKIKEVIDIYRPVSNNYKGVLFVFLLVFFWYFSSITGRVLLAWGLGINLSFIDLSTAILMAGFILMLPFSISGIGLRELSYISLLNFFGVAPEQALMLSTVDFIILLSVVSFGGISLIINNISLIKIKDDKKNN